MGASSQEFENWQVEKGYGKSGLEYRYEVYKISDPEGKHQECRYFVLDPQHDPVARAALYYYAMHTDNDVLSNDLLDWYEQSS